LLLYRVSSWPKLAKTRLTRIATGLAFRTPVADPQGRPGSEGFARSRRAWQSKGNKTAGMNGALRRGRLWAESDPVAARAGKWSWSAISSGRVLCLPRRRSSLRPRRLSFERPLHGPCPQLVKSWYASNPVSHWALYVRRSGIHPPVHRKIRPGDVRRLRTGDKRHH
jgi:hypothetical protein